MEQAPAGAAFTLQPTITLQHVTLLVTQPAAITRAATVALRPNWSITSTAPAAAPRPSASSISPTPVLQE